VRNFLKRKNNRLDLLREYLHDLATMLEYISRIHVSYLKDPYKEIVWLST
jgi:hypothetical protein